MLGSKYENLVKLKENGFNVPEFEIIKFENFIENNKPNFEISIQSDKYAVRSSSNIEDGKNDSFAGQFDTYLNVKKEELNDKIIECFKSLYNENVLEYASNKKIDIKDLKMNVIVQEMIQSEYSGIIFTANPQGVLNESVIVVGKRFGGMCCFR